MLAFPPEGDEPEDGGEGTCDGEIGAKVDADEQSCAQGGGGGGPVQAETGKVPENEPALPSVVWLAVQLEETSALPAESGIGTVNVYVAKGKDTFPLRVVGDPPVGV